VSEIKDAKNILRMLLEYPSHLGKKELTQLKADGWKLLADESDDLAKIKLIIFHLMEARKKPHGRNAGSLGKSRYETDKQVFELIARGSTTAAAIRTVYGEHEFGMHKRRITDRKRTMKALAALAARHDEGGD
jgi:hypothetical protein